MSDEEVSRSDLAAWFALAGNALLSPGGADLAARVRALREQLWVAAAMREELRLLADDLAADESEWRREHVRLFLDPAGAPCPPWQSLYSDDPRLMGDSHASALDWYRRESVQPCLENEPADHAGLLLMFLSHLLDVGAPLESVRGFYRDHLQWLEDYLPRLERTTRLPLFARVARVTATLLERLEDELQAPAPADQVM